MEPAATLRVSTPDDQDFLFVLYASTREEELRLWGWDEHQQRAFLEMQFRGQNQHYGLCYPQADSNIILFNDQPVGRLLIDRSRQEILLVDIALLPEYQNRHIGTTLIQSLLREAAGAQKNVELHVLRGSAAVRLYERLGFTNVADDGVYLNMKKTYGEDRRN